MDIKEKQYTRHNWGSVGASNREVLTGCVADSDVHVVGEVQSNGSEILRF